jgi:hypothetical protein
MNKINIRTKTRLDEYLRQGELFRLISVSSTDTELKQVTPYNHSIKTININYEQ